MKTKTIKLMTADNFFPEEDVDKLWSVADSLRFQEKECGEEIENFNLFFPWCNEVFSETLGEEVQIDEERSGVFRRSMYGVHFEGFDDPDEWCLIIPLERNTLNIFEHVSGVKTALEGYQFGYKNMFEWVLTGSLHLEKNQAVFIRPWVFHSLEGGNIVQYYRITKKKEKNDDSGD
jgi:hypothetical protein